QTILPPPAAEKNFLGNILSVFGAADQEPERAYQLVAYLREGAQEQVPGRGHSRGLGNRPSDGHARLFHTATLSDEELAVWIAGWDKKMGISRATRSGRDCEGCALTDRCALNARCVVAG